MFETRLATEADAELISEQRRRMFVDSSLSNDARLKEVTEKFVPWVRERLVDGRYVGWLTAEDGRVVAGAGVLFMDFPPHWMDPEPVRAYLLNVYVEPEFRGRGLARELLEIAVKDAQQRGIKVMSLHASTFGRPLYERNGFKSTNEMILWSEEDVAGRKV
jgi:ribosomal protein S18 acetylase RimI-like enzyme